MTSIIPEGSAVRKAVQWVSQMREEERKVSLKSLVEQACVHFNLSPKDSDFLNRFFSEQESTKTKED